MSEYECVHTSHVNYNDNQNYRLVALVQQLTHTKHRPRSRKQEKNPTSPTAKNVLQITKDLKR